MSTQTLDSLCGVNPETLGTATPMDMEFRYLDISAVTKGRIDWSTTRLWKYADAPSRARRRLRSGDVLLCTVRPGLQAHARIRQEENAPLVGSTGFAVLRPDLAGDSGFVFHQLFSDSVAVQLRALETGSSYPAVNEGDVRRVRVFCPEKEERWRMAAVLDTVDEAIAKTEAVTAKLRQVRAGLLRDLLTRGLDPHGQLRDPIAHPEQFEDSPLGRIPREWDIEKLAVACSLIKDGAHIPPKRVEAGPLLLGVQNMIDDQFQLTDADTRVPWEFFEAMHRTWQIIPGDVLLAVVGATIGKVARVPSNFEPFTLQRSVAILRGRKDLLENDYLEIFLRGSYFQSLVKNSSNATAQAGLYLGQIAGLNIPLPKPEEQLLVSKQIQEQEQEICLERTYLSKLVALKSGLMTDLLTGRVRVPETIRVG